MGRSRLAWIAVPVLGAVAAVFFRPTAPARREIQSEPTVIASAQAAEPPASRPKRTLNVHLPEDIVTLDWNQSVHEVDLPLILNLQEGLTVLDKELKPRPSIAESWSYDTTGTQLKFRIRSNARWSDGKPVKAQDFVDTFRRILLPKNGYSTAYFLFPIVGAEDFSNGKFTDFGNVGIKAPSEDTLEVSFRDPSWRWAEYTAIPALFPIRPDIVAANQKWAVPGMVTNGPFIYLSHTLGKEFLLRARDDFPGRKSNIDEIKLHVLDFDAAVKGFKDGEIDIIFRMPRRFMGDLKGVKTAVIYENRLNRTRKLDVNKKRYPTSNLEFRRALASSIDHGEMLKRAGVPYVPATSLVPKGFPGHYAKGGIPFDERQAKRDLTKAGANLSTIEMLVPLFDDSKDEDRELAIELKRQWESRLKIRVEIVFATTVAQYLLLRDSEAYHVLLRDFNVDSGDPLNFYSAYAHGARFKMEWPDRRYQVMLQEAGRARTESERNRTIAQLDDYLLKETVTVVPLYYRGDLSVVRSSIKGYDNASWQPYFLKNLSFK